MSDADKLDARLEMFQRWEQSEHAHIRAAFADLKEDLKEIKHEIKTLNEMKVKLHTYASLVAMISGLIGGWLVKNL